jgi:hypothetical protein
VKLSFSPSVGTLSDLTVTTITDGSFSFIYTAPPDARSSTDSVKVTATAIGVSIPPAVGTIDIVMYQPPPVLLFGLAPPVFYGISAGIASLAAVSTLVFFVRRKRAK